ncbi:hypothetical protein ABT025_01230 [Streptomyces sp. NPDC002809]|uniref:hypothetical protein n=1 Tax=Streptomyces sp. NPDC002809 TaxID=3154433 RepID=UPI003326C358
MGSAEGRVWELLSRLRQRAEAHRKAQGLPSSQSTVETALKAASAPPGARGFSRKRISDWAPRDADAFKLPQSGSDDKVLALAALWADWAQEPPPGRELRNLLEKARDEQARERRTPSEEQPDEESVSDLTAEQLEVHAAPLPAAQHRMLPALSPYLSRDLDAEVRTRIREALSGRSSALLVLTGESSTGKTRALYEAVREVAPKQPLLRPATAQDLLSLLADGTVRPGTVLWLNEFQRILYDGEGERAAAQLRLFLDRHQGVAAVATLWQNPYWQELTAQGRPRDPHPHARALLIGAHAHRIRVPGELSPEERDQWRRLAEHHGDDRLKYAERAGAQDGRIVQHLSGGPELLDAYLSGPGDHFTRHEHALVTAALDAHRFGHTAPLPAALLAQAADGTLAPHHRAAREDWAAPLLDALAGGEREDGTRTDIRCTLTPLRARRDAAGSPPLYEPTDYLRQHVPGVRVDQAGSAALWKALCRHTTDVAVLEGLQKSAWERGLFRYALDLDRKAALAGSGHALIRIVERTATHPAAGAFSRWAAEQIDLSEQHQVNRLFAALGAAGAQGAMDTLARRLVDRTDPGDAWAVGSLAAHLSDLGASSEIIHTLVDALTLRADELAPRALALALPRIGGVAKDSSFRSLAQRAVDGLCLVPGDVGAVNSLIRALKAAGASDLLESFASRAVTAARDMDPDELPLLMKELWQAGAETAVRSLISLGPESRTGLTDVSLALSLLQVLHEAGADDAVRALLNRGPARQVELANPDDVYSESGVCELLGLLQEMGAMNEFAVLADRASAGIGLDDPGVITTILELLHSTGHEQALSKLLRRDLPAHLWYENPREVQPLLTALRSIGATDVFEAVAEKLVDDVDWHVSEFLQEAVEVLVEVGAERAVDVFVARAKEEAGTGHGLLSVLALSEGGAPEAARELAEHSVAQSTDTDLDDVSLLAWYCHTADAPAAVTKLLDRGLVDRADVAFAMEPDAHSTLLEIMSAVGADETARSFAERAADGIGLDHTMAVASLLTALNAAGLSGPRDVLVERAAGASLRHPNSVTRLLEALMEAGADEVVQDLLDRDPASQVDLNWGTPACGERLLAALRKAGSRTTEDLARRARAAGCLPVESLLPYGLDTDGRPAVPWSWSW